MQYRFADCLLDTSLRTVQRAGEHIPLPPKAFALLLYLLEHHERVVSKNELCERVWQGIAISDAALESCLRDVRRALGDRGQTQRIIQTRWGHGYRFVAEVTVHGDHDTRDVPPSDSLPPQDRASPVGHRPVDASCPTCQHPNPEDATFCTSCGTRLRQPGALPVIHSPSPAEARSGAERKPVTVLSCAVTWSRSGPRDPETLHRLMRALQALARDVVPQYEGHVHAELGDRLLVLFGVPIAREDDAGRAMQAALALRHRFQTQRDGDQTGTGVPMALQMGLHTGPVVVEGAQEEGANPATIAGEVVSVAMALQEQAEPGQVLCSETTARLLRGTVRLARGLPMAVRGEPAALTAHAVLGPRGRRLPGRRTAGRRRSPFVGRQREMATLHALLGEVEAGRGQVVGIVGEAGIGKSRLLLEFRRSLRQRSVTYVTGQCLSYGSMTPYVPVLYLLREVCGITAADRPDALTAKVIRGLQALDMRSETWAPLLLHFLGVQGGEAESLTSLSPEVRKTRTLEALTQMCLHGGRQRPLLLAIEDLHWIDASSEEALATLIEAMAGAPIYLLLTYRPGYQPARLDRSYASQISVQPLTLQDSRRVIDAILSTTAHPISLGSHILTKADGNPFFLEELANTVVEQGPDAMLGSVPDTVQAVLRARLDRLPTTIRGVLQAAAVIGKDVAVPLLQALTEVPEPTLSQALRHLQAAEFLYAAPARGAPMFAFKHALTQEVSYASLLRGEQQQHHARLAQALVEQFPDTVEQQPEVVARHYTAAGLPLQALPFWERAGQRAIARAALVEAVSHFTQSLDLLLTLPDTPERHQHELALRLAMAIPLWMVNGADPEVERSFARTYALAQQWGDTTQRVAAIWGLGTVYLTQARLDACREFSDSVLALARQESDPVFLHIAHLALGIVCFYRGEFPAARKHLEDSRALYDPQRGDSLVAVFGADTGVLCQARWAWAMWVVGDADQAVAKSERAVAMAQELGHPPSLGYAWLFAAAVQQCRRDVPRVLEHADALLALAREHDLSFFRGEGSWLREWALVHQGDVEGGLTRFRQVVTTRLATHGVLVQPYALACLAEAHGHAGQPDAGLRVVAEALALADTHGVHWYDAELYRLQGELVLQQAADDEVAERHFQQARALARQQGARFWELRAVVSLNRLWHRQGKTTKARALLEAACQTFTEGFETPDLCRAWALLDTSHRSGDGGWRARRSSRGSRRS